MTTSETNAETPPMPSPQNYRRALPWWLQAIVLIVVFVAGGVAGSMLTTRVIHSRMEQYRQQAPVFSEDIVARLRFRLALSDQQVADVRRIIEVRHSKMIRYRNEGSHKMHTEFNAMVDEVARVLDEFQAQRWRRIADHVKRTYLPPESTTSKPTAESVDPLRFRRRLSLSLRFDLPSPEPCFSGSHFDLASTTLNLSWI